MVEDRVMEVESLPYEQVSTDPIIQVITRIRTAQKVGLR